MLNSNTFDLAWIFRVLRRWVKLIAGLVILAAIIAFLITFLLPPVYKATTTLIVQPSKDSQSTAYNNLIAGQQLALTYSQMVTERVVLERVISQYNLGLTPEQFAAKIDVVQMRDTQLIQITVSDSNAQRAQKLADGVAAAFIKRTQELQQDRYNSSLSTNQAKIDSLNTQIADTQKQIDNLNLQNNNQQVELTHLNTVLKGYQDDFTNVQQNYQTVQQSVAQSTGNVYIAQPAQSNGQTATVTILVGQSPITGVGASTTATQDQVNRSYNQLLINGPALNTGITSLGLAMTPQQLAQNVDVTILPGTNVLHLSVTDKNPDTARRLADAISVPYLEQIKALLSAPYSSRLDSLQKQMDDLTAKINQTQADIKTLSATLAQSSADLTRLQNAQSEYRTDLRSYQQSYDQTQLTAAGAMDSISVTDPARLPTKSSSNRLLYTGMAAVVGLLLGAGLAFLLEAQDNRIKSAQDVNGRLNLPTLGTISRLGKENEELVMCSDPMSNIAEDFRVLSTMVRLSHPESPLHTLLVTSPTASEGKSLVASNLAVALAKSGQKVVLIDADLRLPRIHTIFNLSNSDGLAETVINRRPTLNLQPTLVDGLKVLTSGNGATASAGILNSPYLVRILNHLTTDPVYGADFVIIDCPPVLALADAAILSSIVDGVLLVFRSNYSEIQNSKEAVKSLEQVKANILGVVLNDVVAEKKDYRYYHYYSGSGKDGSAKADGMAKGKKDLKDILRIS